MPGVGTLVRAGYKIGPVTLYLCVATGKMGLKRLLIQGSIVMVDQGTPLSVEQFWDEYAGEPYQLIRGKVAPVKPAEYMHGAVVSRVVALLYGWVRKCPEGGVVTTDAGFVLASDTLCKADCAFIACEDSELLVEPETYFPFAPDLVVEVVTSNDKAAHVRDKIVLYRAAETRIIWVIYPSLRRVDVHLLNGTSCEVGTDGMLNGGDVLPGLRIEVAELFPFA